MCKTREIARPCGDCWTRIESENMAYRLMIWAERMYLCTGNCTYDRISRAAGKLAMIDTDKLMTLIMAFMAGAAAACICLLLATHGMDAIPMMVKAFWGRITGIQRALMYNPDANGILYVLGLAG